MRTRIPFGLLFTVCFARPAWSEWPPDGVRLTTNPTVMWAFPAAVSDGKGGALISWIDFSSTLLQSETLLQQLTSSGDVGPGWRPVGAVITIGGKFVELAPDGKGGSYSLWSNDLLDVRLRRMGSRGLNSPGWPLQGVLLRQGSVNDWNLASDSRGALVAFAAYDSKVGPGGVPTGSFAVFAVRVQEDGTLAPDWPPSGVSVCESDARKDRVQVVSDDANGAYVAWCVEEPHPIYTSGWPSRVVRLTSNGTMAPGWSDCGRQVFNTAGFTLSRDIATDGHGGLYVLSVEARSLEAGTEVFLQRILADGNTAPGWPAEGLRLSSPGLADRGTARLVVDRGGDPIAVWLDSRGPNDSHISVMRVLPSGKTAPGWPAGGLVLPTTSSAVVPRVATDGIGGVYIAWETGIGPANGDVVLQCVTADGSIPEGWPAEGMMIAGGPGVQGAPTLVSDGARGVIAIWIDHPGTANAQLFGLRIGPDGGIGGGSSNPEPRVDASPALLGFAPNPLRGDDLHVAFALASADPATLEVFDLRGRRVAAQEVRGMGPGPHVVRLASPRLEPGVYWIRFSQSGLVRSARGVVVR